MQQQNSLREEKLILDNRNSLFLSGVESVDGFNEQLLKLSVNKSKMHIIGENIKIISYNKANGNLEAKGEIVQIKYLTKKQPIIKRIFK